MGSEVSLDSSQETKYDNKNNSYYNNSNNSSNKNDSNSNRDNSNSYSINNRTSRCYDALRKCRQAPADLYTFDNATGFMQTQY